MIEANKSNQIEENIYKNVNVCFTSVEHALFSPTTRHLPEDNWHSPSYLYFSLTGTVTANRLCLITLDIENTEI